ncbi:MAG: hypothetical protein FRX49_03467 [Trebouxia sp. A1-2]|nr:MAG: hypothetical protein FRX49_03467 [Trebouxia sp. A1-2]
MKEAIGLLGFFRPVAPEFGCESLKRHANIQTNCVQKSKQKETMRHKIRQRSKQHPSSVCWILNRGAIEAAQLVVGLIAFPQTQQDLVGLVNRWLRDHDWLETCIPFKGRVLLNVFPVFVKGSGANALQLPTCQGRLQDVGSVNGTLSSTSTNQGVDLINHLQ